MSKKSHQEHQLEGEPSVEDDDERLTQWAVAELVGDHNEEAVVHDTVWSRLLRPTLRSIVYSREKVRPGPMGRE